MLRAGWSLANSSNILSDLNGEIAYVLRVPRIIPVYRAALRNSRQFTAEKKAKRQQQRPDCHIDTRNTRLRVRAFARMPAQMHFALSGSEQISADSMSVDISSTLPPTNSE